MINKVFLYSAVVILAFLTSCADPQGLNPPASHSPTPTPNIPSPPSPTGISTPSQEVTVDPTPTSNQTQVSQIVDEQLIWISPSADLNNRIVSVDPLNEERLAYCAPQEIRHSTDGGQSWETVSTSGVAAVAESNGYSIYDNDPAFPMACLSVTLDPLNSASFYGVFTTAHQAYGAPPVFYMGFSTHDGGTTWQLIPHPSDRTSEDFGGFWIDGDGSIEALFSKSAQSTDSQNPVYVQEALDGGQTWEPGVLSCPAFGPCLRWGPAPFSIPGMGSPLPQSVLVSFDDGETWQDIKPPAELRAPPPNQLAAFADEEAAIVSSSIALSDSGTSQQPYRKTQDSGLTWENIPLPSLPVEDPSFTYFPGLQILPDGSFLSQNGEGTDWYWLPTGDQEWCAISIDTLPDYPVLLRAVGQRLWWVNPSTQQAENFNLSEISCGGGE